MMVIAALTLAAALAPAPEAGRLTFTSPRAGEPAVGQVTATVVAEPAGAIRRVTFFVDGRRAGEAAKPPWTVTLDLGYEPVSHSIRAVAVTAAGERVEAEIVTAPFEANAHIEVELRQLYVGVSRGGKAVTDLIRDDFTVIDDGREQVITSFARGDTPISAVVLLDASRSMAGPRLAAAVDGARAFFSTLAPLDEGRLIVYSDRIQLATPFTSFPEALLAGLGRVRATGGTALNDTLYLALSTVEERLGRRVVILLSDGVDSHSALTGEEVLHTARRSRALLYWIRLVDPGQDPGETPSLSSTWRDVRDHGRDFEALGEAVAVSGGRIVPITGGDATVPAFASVLQELRDQYVLSYTPTKPRRDGSWRKVTVKVHRSGVRVSAREGYLDF